MTGEWILIYTVAPAMKKFASHRNFDSRFAVDDQWWTPKYERPSNIGKNPNAAC